MVEYTKRLKLNHVDLTEDNILHLVKLIDTQFGGEIYLKKYTISFFDDSEISSNMSDVFLEYEFRNKRVKKICIDVFEKEGNRFIAELYSTSYNYIIIASSDKNWFNGFCNLIEDFINTLKKQSLIFNLPYKELLVFIFIALFYAFFDTLAFLFIVKLIPNGFEFIVLLLLLMFSALSFSFLFCVVENAYPILAFDFGVEENKIFKKYRNVLKWIFGSMILPILLDIFLYFLL